MVEDVPVFNDKKQDGKQAKNIQRGLQNNKNTSSNYILKIIRK